MKVRVKVYGHLQTIFNSKKFEVELPYQSTLDDLINKIGAIYGKEKTKELYPQESARFPLIIIVGNKDYRFINGMNTLLEDGTTVYFIPPAVGG